MLSIVLSVILIVAFISYLIYEIFFSSQKAIHKRDKDTILFNAHVSKDEECDLNVLQEDGICINYLNNSN